jgi:CheY-like chemotaxis protein
MRLLVVDDDAPSRYLLESVFSARGHKVESASDGEEALEKARANPPEMIISDILMPVVDGYRLCIEWHQDARLAPIVFAYYTATYVEDADEDFALSLGADAFLRKPMETHTLIHTIEKIHRETKVLKRSAKRAPAEEIAVMRQYNERLVAKLEKKVADLQKTTTQLRLTIDLLSDEVSAKDALIRRLSDELAKQTTSS